MIAYLLTKDGKIENTVIVDPENIIFDDCITEPVPEGLVTPKWNRKSKKWTEGATQKQLSERLEGLKEEKKSGNRLQVRTLCLEIAEEIEQTNWLNFPEDYEPEEIEELKNQIREIRTKGREIRANIDAAQSLEEIYELDLNIIPEEVEGE
ncbi:MAG: hypothetical protein CMP21_04115 [Rickettsiales bacterium]|nr:hypothetical protein [Rickettsiales bacterium]|tara:strand:- start:3669 stop:4121 length:453 start_codon:yes stop_codon:yes gene_type:complete